MGSIPTRPRSCAGRRLCVVRSRPRHLDSARLYDPARRPLRADRLSRQEARIRITALTPQPGRAGRIAVEVDGVVRLTTAPEVVAAAGLRVGDEVGESALATLEEGDLAWRVRQAALDLLAHRPRSVAELRRRLLRKGFPDRAVDACLADLHERGWLDDDAFAATFVRERIRRRPRGRRGLLAELRSRGVGAERAARVVEETLAEEDVSELELARAAARAWSRRAGRVEPAADPAAKREAWLRQRRRLYAYLARRGFSADVIGAVVAEVTRRRQD